MKRNPGLVGNGPAIVAVADDGGDLNGKFVEFRPPEDFVEAVVGFGDENRRLHAVGQAAEMPGGLQRAAERAEAANEILDIDVQIRGCDFQPGEKLAAELIGKLGELDEVSFMAGD